MNCSTCKHADRLTIAFSAIIIWKLRSEIVEWGRYSQGRWGNAFFFLILNPGCHLRGSFPKAMSFDPPPKHFFHPGRWGKGGRFNLPKRYICAPPPVLTKQAKIVFLDSFSWMQWFETDFHNFDLQIHFSFELES